MLDKLENKRRIWFYEKMLKFRKENEELRKENLFLKKQRHSLQKKSIRGLSVMEQYQKGFGLRRLKICPNAYYNYRKHWKADYDTQKSRV